MDPSRSQTMRAVRRRTSVVFGIAALLASCGASAEESVLVFGAASLTDVLTETAEAYEVANPGVDVELNLAGSGRLREQLLSGAEADVFVPADRAQLDAVDAAGLIEGEAVVVARNGLVLAVPDGNPGSVTGLGDLAREELLVGVCAAGVPCGDLARVVLDDAGVEARPDTESPDVRSLLTRLRADELDVGLVYRTDALAASDEVDVVEGTWTSRFLTEYPVAVLADAPAGDSARSFAAFLAGPEAAEVFRRAGFETP